MKEQDLQCATAVFGFVSIGAWECIEGTLWFGIKYLVVDVSRETSTRAGVPFLST